MDNWLRWPFNELINHFFHITRSLANIVITILLYSAKGLLKREEFAGENPNTTRICKRFKGKIAKPILMEKEVIDFLDSILAENTRKSYIRALEVFEEYAGKSISEIIKQRRIDFNSTDMTVKRGLDREVNKFYVWLINERKVAQNSAYAYVTGIKSIMSYYDINLKLRGIKRVPTLPNDWVPNPDQLRELFQVGGLTEKTILAVALNIPLRINDFNEIKKKDILPLLNSSEYPAQFMLLTKKTKTPMPCFISQETMQILGKYVKTLREDNPYLFQGRGRKKLNEDSINRILKKLVKKADVDTRGLRVRFHLFRKVFIGVARSMIGLSDDQIRMLSGKRVKGDMSPYYITVQLKPLFEKISEKLRLTGLSPRNHVTLESLKKTIATQQLELIDQKNRVNALAEDLIEQGENWEESQKWLKELKSKTYKIIETQNEQIKILSDTKLVKDLLNALKREDKELT